MMSFLMNIVLIFASQAQLTENTNLLQPHVEKPLLNEIVAFYPIEGHKFNLKSKNDCGKGRLISVKEDKAECQLTIAGKTTLELYVCDKKNTYCKREQVGITVSQPKGIQGWISYYWNRFFNSSSWNAGHRTEVSHNKAARGFMQNDLKGAIAKAKKENKNIFLYFTQIYCPPCRMMKELTFETDAFQKIAKDLVLIQIDTDIDVEPTLVKPLEQKYTPTVVVLTPDFKEIDRSVGVMSPESIKTWLAKLREMNWTPAEALAKKENLSGKEKRHLSQWYFSRFENEKMQEYAQELEGKWQVLASGLTIKEWKEKVKVLKKFNFSKLNCGTKSMKAAQYIIGEIFDAAVNDKSTNIFNYGTQFMDDLEKVTALNEGDDALACAYDQGTIYSYLKYYYDKMDMDEKVSEMNHKILAHLDTYPKLPGVKETTQLEVERVDAMNDEKAKDKLYAKLREENRQDYTYDYWEANDAYRAGKYEEALAKINESLSIAKDRSWQKAFKLKLEILKKMKKTQEAENLIQQTLKDITLPYSQYPKVHNFVQELRQKQQELRKI